VTAARSRSPSQSDVARLETVRHGWDRLTWVYRPVQGRPDVFGHASADYREWLRPLVEGLSAGDRVLDLGCGSGVPATRHLARKFRVLGVDLSGVQVRRARAAVPTAAFRQGEMTSLRFPPARFEGIVALYSLIHVPVRRQPLLIRRMARWLVPGGWCVAIVGHRAWTGTEPDWLGGGVEMYWSHAGARTYRRWFRSAGFRVLEQRFVPEGGGGHELFVLRTAPHRGGRATSSGP
jgi:SAM-dependent methyltransferase